MGYIVANIRNHGFYKDHRDAVKALGIVVKAGK